MAFRDHIEYKKGPPSRRTAHKRIPIDQPISTRIRNSRALSLHHIPPVPLHRKRHVPRLPIKRHGEMVNPARRRPQRSRGPRPDLDADVRGAGDEDGQENLVLSDDGGVVDGLVGVDGGAVAGGAAGGAGAGGVEAVPEDELLGGGGDGGGGGVAALVGVDVVREDVAPVVVRHVGDVALGAGGDAGPDGTDVVRFAVVVPGDDLGGVGEWVGGGHCWRGEGGG